MDDPSTPPLPQEDMRLMRAREVLAGCPVIPYSTAVSAAERSFWLERVSSSLRDCLDMIAERDWGTS